MRYAIFHRDDRIGEDGEVGPATCPVDRIAVCLPIVEVRRGGTRQVSASRESPDANAFGVDAVVLCIRPNVTDGPLRVFERRGMERAGPVFGHDSILEHERGHAMLVEPLRDLLPLMIVGEETVAAAGADD